MAAKKFRPEKKYKYLDIIIFGLYLVFNVYLLIRHDMWRDEVNVYLMTRDLTPLELIREIHLQGHPCLWYFVVMPFAKLGVPCKVMCVLSFLSIGSGAFLFYFKAPINRIFKAIALFSPVFTFFYSVVARGYCLVGLLVILTAYFHDKRNKLPLLYGLLLGLLVQADTIGVPMAGLLSLMWLFQNIRNSVKHKGNAKIKDGFGTAVKGLWIPLVSLGFYLYQMMSAGDSTAYEIKKYGLSEMIGKSLDYAYYIVRRLTGWTDGIILLFVIVLVCGLAWLALRSKTFWPFIVLWGYISFDVLFSVIVYELNIWHFITLAYVLIWTIWVYNSYPSVSEHRMPRIPVNIILGVFCVFMFVRWCDQTGELNFVNAVSGVFSNSREAAEFIEENVDPSEIIVADGAPFVGAVFGYAEDYRYYLASTGKETSYADWSDEQCGETTFEGMKTWIVRDHPDANEFIFIRSSENYVTDIEDYLGGFTLLYRSENPSAMHEDFEIYKVVLK